MRLIRFVLCVFAYFSVMACSGSPTSDGCSSGNVGGGIAVTTQCLNGTGGSGTGGSGTGGGATGGTFAISYTQQPPVASISVGFDYICALLEDATVKCWGTNEDGQLGNGTLKNSPTPTSTGLKNVQKIFAGPASACALIQGGTIKCWGANQGGEVSGTTKQVSTPISVPGISGATDITVGSMTSLAVQSDGGVACWGTSSTDMHECAGLTGKMTKATTVDGITDIKAIFQASEGVCALKTDGSVVCWGWWCTYVNKAQICTVDASPRAIVDSQGRALSGMTQITAGSNWTGFATDGSKIYAWGYNGSLGLLGNGSTADTSSYVTVNTSIKPQNISAGSSHACAAATDGTVWCWGANDYGQLGDGTTTNHSTPVKVVGITSAKAVYTNLMLSCAVLTNGAAYCWGANNRAKGVLGNGRTDIMSSSVPLQVLGL